MIDNCLFNVLLGKYPSSHILFLFSKDDTPNKPDYQICDKKLMIKSIQKDCSLQINHLANTSFRF